VLYEELTTEEHLKFVMDIKENDPKKKQEQIELIITAVQHKSNLFFKLLNFNRWDWKAKDTKWFVK